MNQREVQNAWDNYLNYCKTPEYNKELGNQELRSAKEHLTQALYNLCNAHNAWMAAELEDEADDISALLANIKHDIEWITDLNK